MINQQLQKGFTLVEMIVSLAVFSVVVTISIGALLSLIAANKQLQAEQSVMTNLSFALDSMTREIRTGTNYFCASVSNVNAAVTGATAPNHQIFRNGINMDAGLLGETEDCHNGGTGNIRGIAFVETGDSITGAGNERILYFFDNAGKIMRKVGSGNAQSIVSSGIYVTEAKFFVTGSNRLSAGGTGQFTQPTVTIFIEARETSDPGGKLYQIQTTVTQRTLDI